MTGARGYLSQIPRAPSLRYQRHVKSDAGIAPGLEGHVAIQSLTLTPNLVLHTHYPEQDLR